MSYKISNRATDINPSLTLAIDANWRKWLHKELKYMVWGRRTRF